VADGIRLTDVSPISDGQGIDFARTFASQRAAEEWFLLAKMGAQAGSLGGRVAFGSDHPRGGVNRVRKSSPAPTVPENESGRAAICLQEFVALFPL